MQTLLHGGMAVGLTLALTACNETDSAQGVLLRVNDQPITVFDFNVRQVSGGVPKDFSETSQQKVLDAIVEAELMYQKGLALGLDEDPGFQRAVAMAEAKLAMMKRQEMQERVYQREVASKVQITDEQAKEYYETHKTDITHEYHLGSLQFPEQGKAREVVKRLRKGESFETVANDIAAKIPGFDGDDPDSLRKLWDMSYVRWRQIPPAIMEVIAGMKAGDVSEPIQHDGSGYIVLKLLDKREIAEADFPSLRAELKEALRTSALKERERRFYDALRRSARIQHIAKPKPSTMTAAAHP